MKNKFQIWKTIKLGTYKNCEQLKKDGFVVRSEWTKDILNTTDNILNKLILKEIEEINLINISASDLGFKTNTRYWEIYTKAKEFGLEICPAKTGPELRLQYKDQPKYEWLHIAMEPIVGSCGFPLIFMVGHSDWGDNNLYLGATRSCYGDSVGINNRFIFCL